MQRSTTALLGFALACSLAAWLLFRWWLRLIQVDFAACLAPVVPAGVDCSHAPQFHSAMGFAIVAIALFLVAATRGVITWMKHRQPR